MTEKFIGKVTHYFPKIAVAGIELESPLEKGDRIHINGHTTDVEQRVDSMEIDHAQIQIARPGDSVAIHVRGKVRPNDSIYLVTEEELTTA